MTDISSVSNPMAEFDPWPPAQVHVEWGIPAAAMAAERGDIVVIVDVLSFSTTVSIAIERGAAVMAMSLDDIAASGGRDQVAAEHQAHVAAKKRDDPDAKFTLSPASLGGVEPGDRLILTSWNGAAATAAARPAPAVLIGCLRNASAVADQAAQLLSAELARRITVIASAEHWSSVGGGDGIRSSLEDWLGAGAIASALSAHGATLSVEAAAAGATFNAFPNLSEALRSCISGRELITKGFGHDVELAAKVDVTDTAPLRRADSFFRS